MTLKVAQGRFRRGASRSGRSEELPGGSASSDQKPVREHDGLSPCLLKNLLSLAEGRTGMRHGLRLSGQPLVMSRTVWFLTSNAGKLEEAKHHFQPLGIEVNALEVPEGSIIEPQSDDLEAVARAKLRKP